MYCPKCNDLSNIVSGTRHVTKNIIVEKNHILNINAIRRIRTCKCGYKWITYEAISDEPIGSFNGFVPNKSK